ncbi:Dynamin-like GTPase that mediates homotypic ER fusion [Malassezia cuniculi]|uniref:Dynamin-like GTPase that mediates homotypic ER fusion n=1 Tax=Malassezia cuniculi TaxID=948313 RepID=A0AAF0ESV3_9BASI|nr:Dynamin-like GTPase that mediates homotypic ER fusion [Malassezia cuniculi]
MDINTRAKETPLSGAAPAAEDASGNMDVVRSESTPLVDSDATPSAAEPPAAPAPEPQTAPAAAASAEPASANSSAGATAASAAEGASTDVSRMQLIDDSQHIYSDELQKRLGDWSLAEVGFGYDMCAVLGSQSTGKSTLLNKLFGTKFDVMDERRRRQTTKGIWISRSNEKNILVMDVEGTDGRERGEDQDFERKSSLFALSTAECLIVNMWENQVGLYQGANMGLLKTVLDVNLTLFQASRAGASREKTMLLFVIRDFVGMTPLEDLRDTVTNDLHRIWQSLNKPAGLEDAQLEDFFDLSFAALPHKVLQPNDFNAAVDKLRQRFTNTDDKDYVFRTQYHKRIPADGLPHYLAGVWEQVVQNKDLDLPTQQELLAQFRCDEIAEAAFGVFGTAVRPFRKALEGGGILATLGADMATHRGDALAAFDKNASRYHPNVYARKRADLLARLNAALSPFFLAQLNNLHKSLVQEFRQTILDGVREPGYDFGNVVDKAHAATLAKYDAAAAAVLLEDTDWSIVDERAQFIAELEQAGQALRADECAKMIAQIERELKKGLEEPVALALGRPTPDMWDNVLAARREAVNAARTSFLLHAKNLNCTPDEDEQGLAALERRGWLAIITRIKGHTSEAVLSVRLQRFFEERFRYDTEGVPRVWRPSDDIDGVYVAARDAALALVPLYARIAPESATYKEELETAVQEIPVDDELDLGAAVQVLTTLQCTEIGARLRRDADALYLEAKRSTVSGIAQVPVWMYGVLVVLGWNEAMAVLYSPIYFTLLCIGLATSYVVWRLNMGGPIFTVVSAVVSEVQKLAEKQLREYLSEPRLAQPVRAPGVSSGGDSSGGAAAIAANNKETRSSAAPEELELENRSSRGRSTMAGSL